MVSISKSAHDYKFHVWFAEQLSDHNKWKLVLYWAFDIATTMQLANEVIASVDDNMYMLLYTCRVELSSKWSNHIAISVYARHFIYELTSW